MFPTCIKNILLQDYISDLANALQVEQDEEFILECVGILGNLTIEDLDYELLLTEYNLIDWIKKHLQGGSICYLNYYIPYLKLEWQLK